MKTILFILILPLAALLPGKELKAQVFDIKPWNGTYPEMEGTYPLSFMAFKRLVNTGSPCVHPYLANSLLYRS